MEHHVITCKLQGDTGNHVDEENPVPDARESHMAAGRKLAWPTVELETRDVQESFPYAPKDVIATRL